MTLNSIYTALTVNKQAAISIFEATKNIHGLDCTIRKPVENGRLPINNIFGQDACLAYEETETPAKLLIVDLFKEGKPGTDEFDTFGTDSKLLTLAKDELPLSTTITVNFMGRTMSLDVQEVSNPTPHIGEQVFTIHKLMPST